jgi:hypothetical protein
MSEREILQLNRQMAEFEYGAQYAKGVEKLKLMWKALGVKKELELFI